MNVIDDATTALMSRMVVDQEPQRVKTHSMDMMFYRLSPGSLATETSIPGVEAGFKVPYHAIASDKANDTLYFDTVVRTFKFI